MMVGMEFTSAGAVWLFCEAAVVQNTVGGVVGIARLQ